MNDSTHSTAEFDPTLYRENSNKFTYEQLKPYFGKQVAWSWDGTKILVSGDSYEEVYQELDKAGIPSDRVVLGYVDDPEIGNI